MTRLSSKGPVRGGAARPGATAGRVLGTAGEAGGAGCRITFSCWPDA